MQNEEDESSFHPFSDEEEEYQYSDSEEDHASYDQLAHSEDQKIVSSRPSSSNSSHHVLATPLPAYRIVNLQELQSEQTALIDDLSNVLDLKPSISGILLRHFQWNKEKLFDAYCADATSTCHAAGVQFKGAMAASLDKDAPDVECQICCEVSPSVTGVGCGHRFCTECWVPYLTLKVADGPRCIYTTCPAQGCTEIVPDTVFQSLIPADVYAKYSHYMLRSYVERNKWVKWCPAAGCENAISKTHANTGTLASSMVKCSCGCQFCMKCGEDAHLPASCEQLETWMEKCKNESETANWILANTKKCPKCMIRIEKNQGCNHMNCRHCKHEFCWVCLGGWKEHGSNTGGYYKCNRYDPGTTGSDTSEAAKAKAELDRYLFYYQRYANHSEAGKAATQLRESTETRMIELQGTSCGASWIDVQFLKVATEQLIECRRVLKFTYAFAYYLAPGAEKNLFEYLQENLEKNTEHLTELSEGPLDKMDRSEVINSTRVNATFLSNLLTGVEDGLTEHESVQAPSGSAAVVLEEVDVVLLPSS